MYHLFSGRWGRGVVKERSVNYYYNSYEPSFNINLSCILLQTTLINEHCTFIFNHLIDHLCHKYNFLFCWTTVLCTFQKNSPTLKLYWEINNIINLYVNTSIYNSLWRQPPFFITLHYNRNHHHQHHHTSAIFSFSLLDYHCMCLICSSLYKVDTHYTK